MAYKAEQRQEEKLMVMFRPGGLELTEKTGILLGLKAKDRVLDIGCGLGESLRFLKERFQIEPRGIDRSTESVRRAGADYIIAGDAQRLPFPDGCFDCVLMECMLGLVEMPELALQEAERVLVKGGGLAVSALSGEGLKALTDGGRVDFTRLKAFLQDRGFTVTGIEDESGSLIKFVAQAIFRFGSLEEYISCADRELGGSVLGCEMPPRGTGYKLLLARKN